MTDTPFDDPMDPRYEYQLPGLPVKITVEVSASTAHDLDLAAQFLNTRAGVDRSLTREDIVLACIAGYLSEHPVWRNHVTTEEDKP